MSARKWHLGGLLHAPAEAKSAPPYGANVNFCKVGRVSWKLVSW